MTARSPPHATSGPPRNPIESRVRRPTKTPPSSHGGSCAVAPAPGGDSEEAHVSRARRCVRDRIDDADAGIESSRGPAHQPGSARGQHRRLRLRQPEQPRPRHAHRQLHPVRGAVRRPELLQVRRQRPLRNHGRQQRRCRRGRDVPVPLPDRGPERQHVPLQHRAHHVAGLRELERPPVLQRHPHRRPAAPGPDDAARRQPADAAREHRPPVDAQLRIARRGRGADSSPTARRYLPVSATIRSSST